MIWDGEPTSWASDAIELGDSFAKGSRAGMWDDARKEIGVVLGAAGAKRSGRRRARENMTGREKGEEVVVKVEKDREDALIRKRRRGR